MDAKTSLLIVIPLVISIGQILFKITSRSIAGTDSASIIALAGNPWLLSAVAIYGAATVGWVFVIRDVPISRAYLFMSLTFVAVPIIAWGTLGEPVSLRHIIGTAIIIAGIVVATG